MDRVFSIEAHQATRGRTGLLRTPGRVRPPRSARREKITTGTAATTAAPVVTTEVPYWATTIAASAHSTVAAKAAWPCGGPFLPAQVMAAARRPPEIRSAEPTRTSPAPR